MSWADDLDDELLLQADYPPELVASDSEPGLPSTDNPLPSTADVASMTNDGGQGNLARMESSIQSLQSLPHHYSYDVVIHFSLCTCVIKRKITHERVNTNL